MGCSSCGRGFHSECDVGCTNCHENKEQEQLVKSFKSGLGQPVKNPESVTDPLSTGRKRAAQIYPIFENAVCEWQGKKNCGGGIPIVGCIEGIQVERHHGPVKSPLRNEPWNVSRICTKCHHRWHAINDPVYDEEKYEKLLSTPEPASEIELVANEAYWRVKK